MNSPTLRSSRGPVLPQPSVAGGLGTPKPKGVGGLVAPKRSGVGGFTLLEIMIVVSVVAVLSLLSVAAIHRIRNHATRSAIENNLRQLYQAKEFYYTESGAGQLCSITSLAFKGYISASVKDRLTSTHSFEGNQGWHYGFILFPNLPVYAYQGTQPPNTLPTGEIIYYPGPPANPLDLFRPPRPGH